MQLTITIPKNIEPALKTLAIQNGKSEPDIITSLLVNYFEDDDSDIIAIAKERLRNPAPRIRVTLDEL